MKKILVIGGSGFVSGAVAAAAYRRGHDVWVLTRGERPVPDGVVPITADRHDSQRVEHLVHEQGVYWDAVIDCIGFVEADARQDADVFGPYTDHLIFVSTDFVYRPGHRSYPQAEFAETYNDQGYGASKRRCEKVLIEADTAPVTIFRPCHIYGPGSKLGCLPTHGRDARLIERIIAREPLRLVGGGWFLQQPIYVGDLARVLVEAAGAESTFGRLANVAGPDVVPSRRYYEYIGAALDREVIVSEIPVDEYLAAHPESVNFLDHRVYNRAAVEDMRLPVPSTPLADGLARQVRYLRSDQSVPHWDVLT